MRKLFALSLILIPSFACAQQIAIQNDYTIEGKIFAVKTAKKYASVEGCSKIALKKSKVAGFSYDSKTAKCTLFKRVKNLKAKEGFISGTK